jgi:hypothetical protein
MAQYKVTSLGFVVPPTNAVEVKVTYVGGAGSSTVVLADPGRAKLIAYLYDNKWTLTFDDVNFSIFSDLK